MSTSNRVKRMERHHKRARPATLHLVSLMDIFTILVFFLLVNQAEVQALDVPDTIELPESMAVERPSETVVVMVTPEEILVQGAPVAKTADVESQEGLIVAPLRDALKAQSDRILRAQAAADIASREITILGDKSVPYRVLKKVMATCTDADYGRLSLAVVQKEEAMNMAAAY
ncbi:MAG: biopolymer transporter ExbD [Pseudomonadota bacterium]|jgi:Biopolymer transport protein|nr:MAG: biopolymer transporter ExbD [Pseudomonadota bacterium]